MIAELQSILQEESLLSDELRIIAKDMALNPKDRESLRKSAEVMEQVFRSYSMLHATLRDTAAKLSATEDRLREVNAQLIKDGVFPPIKASGTTVWHPWGSK
jgi:hypothetical protein